MFKKNSGTEGFDTLVGINTVFEGNIESEGIVRVDGKVKGDLRVNGNVIVGSSAVITGNVFANDVHISGTVEGNVHSKGVLRILSTARLYGDIQIHSFIADEGGIFQGKCSMIEPSEAVKTADTSSSKKSQTGKDYKKSSVLSQIYDEKDKNNELNKNE